MKRLPAVILFVLTALSLVTSVTGCRGAQRYDSRLVAADSLMQRFPDSALAVVEGCEGLTAEADLAYHDLLLTQARYKSYIQSTSDSAINCALAYYRAHPKEREKLTRAYIYKGAVMEELDHPDSAMLYYKHAEATAAPDDYFNLGYAKLRIAELYQRQVTQDSSAICRLIQAKHYFTLLKDTNYIIVALGKLGAICGVQYPDSTKDYLNEAIKLAQQFNPSKQYSHKSTLSGVYFYQGDYKKANELAMDVFRNGKDYCNQNQFYYYAALSYIKLGFVDSAKQIINMTPYPEDELDSMNYFDALAEIANAENQYGIYKKYKEESHNIKERILSESKQGVIAVAEVEYDKLQSKKDYEINRKKTLKVVAIVFLSLLSLVMVVLFFMQHQLTKHLNENQAIKQELEHALDLLQQEAGKNKSVSELVAHRIAALNELYQDVRVRVKDENKVKKVIPLTSVLKNLSEKNQILSIKLNESFWSEMKKSVDGEYNGIYSFVERQYPDLTEKDLQIFCLLCANLSPQIIKLCMNLSSARTITNYRSIIIKKKIGLDMSFDEFVQMYLEGHLGTIH